MLATEKAVVILDSDPLTLETLGLVLGRRFPNTRLYQSTLPAFAALMNDDVGVLICEVQLGTENGIALAQALRGRIGNLTPIIFTSIQDSSEVRRQVDAIPSSTYLPKSELQRLPQLVARVLQTELATVNESQAPAESNLRFH